MNEVNQIHHNLINVLPPMGMGEDPYRKGGEGRGVVEPLPKASPFMLSSFQKIVSLIPRRLS